MAVDVEVVEVVVHPEDVQRDVVADRARIVGVLPANARPLIAWKRAAGAVTGGEQRVQEEHVLDVGPSAPRARTTIAPKSPRNVLSVWFGPVVVVRPDADGVRRRLPRVGELLAGRDEAADARVLAHVGAVVVRRVAHAVRVHRERPGRASRGVAEVHDEHVADLGVERRPGHVRGARPGLAKPGCHQLVDERAEGAPARDRAVRASRRGPSARRPTRTRAPGPSTRACCRPAAARASPKLSRSTGGRGRGRAGSGPARRSHRPCGRRRDRRAGPPRRRSCTAARRRRRDRRTSGVWNCCRASWERRLSTRCQQPGEPILPAGFARRAGAVLLRDPQVLARDDHVRVVELVAVGREDDPELRRVAVELVGDRGQRVARLRPCGPRSRGTGRRARARTRSGSRAC